MLTLNVFDARPPVVVLLIKPTLTTTPYMLDTEGSLPKRQEQIYGYVNYLNPFTFHGLSCGQ
jgi:hypothetical protein